MFWHLLTILTAVAVGALTLMQVATMRQVGSLLVQLRPGRIGEVEGGPELDSIASVPGVATDKPAIVLFMSPACSICELLHAAVPALHTHYPEIQVIPVIVGADAARRLEYARRIPGARADIPELADRWDVQGTPFVVGIDDSSRVRSRGVANSLDQLENLADALLLPRDQLTADEAREPVLTSAE